ncbi:glycosyltransferase family 2 protein [Bradyrhizobium sp. CIAT3101]|uniref:glycosyltransferase family 2 protein n=1 Tax=Bradyrhizobium sp. CIAT3101 TaxID=439387 RepID=UPI0024B1EE0F|nr:glycosyltransferase family 2 protein [Bradyrhizobium sp. CIAT3101]WFU79147.1 glycosyltransferase family 2 protein [Bradyrhizobium sp. CIAT3101]
MIKISIIIKTLNEAANIARSIETALAAIAGYDGEVIIADSASTDETVAIAKLFPTTVVVLENVSERRCGVGPQLGYQYCKGEYIYILDGDMELDAGFIRKAIAILDHQKEVAGVGGYIHEMRADNLELQGRIKRFQRESRGESRDVECLNGGGLYRRAAISQAGYLSDRNLHAFEEYDLGARLRAKGWRLVKLEDKAVDHYSYAMGTWRLLWHRILSGRFLSAGELFRGAMAGSYVARVMQEVRIVPISIGVWAYWACAILIGQLTLPVLTLLMALGLPVVAMAIRTRSLNLGLFSVLTWHLSAWGFALGVVKRRCPPEEVIRSNLVHSTAHDVARAAAVSGSVPAV